MHTSRLTFISVMIYCSLAMFALGYFLGEQIGIQEAEYCDLAFIEHAQQTGLNLTEMMEFNSRMGADERINISSGAG